MKQTWFLEHIKLTNFGRFANMIVGPFTPGLNVVYGKNETGKTTINQLVRGVLFGWLAARGNTNSYKPEAAERAGSLFFATATSLPAPEAVPAFAIGSALVSESVPAVQSASEVVEIKRAPGVAPESLPAFASVVGDIDKATFDTMFALTSDELLGLDRHTEVTARLLTAGSGTQASPAHALATIDARIKDLMSKSAQFPDSIPNLRARKQELHDELSELGRQADALRVEKRRLDSFAERKTTLAAKQQELDADIEELRARLAQLESLHVRVDAAQARVNQLEHALADAQTTHAVPTAQAGVAGDALANHAYPSQLELDTSTQEQADIEALAALEQTQFNKLRDSLDTFEDKCVRAEHVVENAQRDARKSTAEFEFAQAESVSNMSERASWRRRQRLIQLAGAILVALALLVLGVFICAQGVERSSITVLGVGALVAIGAVIVGAGAASVLLRPSKEEEAQAERIQKLEWVMLQDKHALDATLADQEALTIQIQNYLDAHHLQSAAGSLKRAHVLLDAVRTYHAERAAQVKTIALLSDQLRQAHEEVSQLEADQADVFWALKLEPATAQAELTARLEQKNHERAQARELAQEAHAEFGRITQELAGAARDTAFDEVKFAYAQVEARLSAAQHQLAVLLIAQSSLTEAIAVWEKKSQPEVYRIASELFALMTDNAWRSVRINPDNQIEVTDALMATRPPELLSLGTRQQLYLALRIALLVTAENVGASLPILADDILVNFDDERRRGAARALAYLAEHRQVILFTCHADVVTLLQEADPAATIVNL
ncbi:MAG: AAA family ATPase [Eggerthellaceae bacterium]|nr:AAA family ATPase [Eggerthellaceae bacterium]